MQRATFHFAALGPITRKCFVRGSWPWNRAEEYTPPAQKLPSDSGAALNPGLTVAIIPPVAMPVVFGVSNWQ